MLVAAPRLDSAAVTQSLKTILTLAVLGLVLLVAVLLGWSMLTQPLPDSGSDSSATPTDAAPCTEETVEPGERIRPRMVTVSVYNAGTTSGLADSTLALLTEKGFGEGETGNAEPGSGVRNVQVWTDAAPDPAARLVASWLGPRVKVVEHETQGVGVMVVVGDEFRGRLAKGPRSVKARKGGTVCVPNAA